jgi:uncharacterized lipoprotein
MEKTSMRTLKIALLILLTTLFSACSTFSTDDKYTHQKIEQIPVESQANEAADKTAATETPTPAPTIVESQNAAVATALANPSTTQSSTTTITTMTAAPVAAPKPSIAEAVNVGGQLGLSINLPYQQVWTQTKKALPQAGYPIMEQDNTLGTYYILDKVSTGGVIKRDTPIYQLHLKKTNDNKTVITLSNAQNQAASTSVAERVLNTLKDKFPS